MYKGYDFGKYEDRIEELLERFEEIPIDKVYKEYQYLKNVALKNRAEVFAIDLLEQEIKMYNYKATDKFTYESEGKEA